MTSTEYIGVAGAIITGASFIFGIGVRLWTFARRMAVLEERVNLLWKAQWRRGHLEVVQKGLAIESPETEWEGDQS